MARSYLNVLSVFEGVERLSGDDQTLSPDTFVERGMSRSMDSMPLPCDEHHDPSMSLEYECLQFVEWHTRLLEQRLEQRRLEQRILEQRRREQSRILNLCKDAVEITTKLLQNIRSNNPLFEGWLIDLNELLGEVQQLQSTPSPRLSPDFLAIWTPLDLYTSSSCHEDVGDDLFFEVEPLFHFLHIPCVRLGILCTPSLTRRNLPRRRSYKMMGLSAADIEDKYLDRAFNNPCVFLMMFQQS